jgi:hypothetical protein
MPSWPLPGHEHGGHEARCALLGVPFPPTDVWRRRRLLPYRGSWFSQTQMGSVDNRAGAAPREENCFALQCKAAEDQHHFERNGVNIKTLTVLKP